MIDENLNQTVAEMVEMNVTNCNTSTDCAYCDMDITKFDVSRTSAGMLQPVQCDGLDRSVSVSLEASLKVQL
jgi:hypothetical protein